MGTPERSRTIEREATARCFLGALFGQGLAGCRPRVGELLVWDKRRRRSQWFRADGLGLDQAARRLSGASARVGSDVYIGAGLRGRRHGAWRRGRAVDVSVLPGLWADIDVLDPQAHRKTRLPRSREAARGFLEDFSLAPSLLVDSGHGLHAWWLFREPWLLDSDRARDHAVGLSVSFHALWRCLARRRGYGWDALPQLDALLRCPGTFNWKDPQHPKPVRLVLRSETIAEGVEDGGQTGVRAFDGARPGGLAREGLAQHRYTVAEIEAALAQGRADVAGVSPRGQQVRKKERQEPQGVGQRRQVRVQDHEEEVEAADEVVIEKVEEVEQADEVAARLPNQVITGLELAADGQNGFQVVSPGVINVLSIDFSGRHGSSGPSVSALRADSTTNVSASTPSSCQTRLAEATVGHGGADKPVDGQRRVSMEGLVGQFATSSPTTRPAARSILTYPSRSEAVFAQLCALIREGASDDALMRVVLDRANPISERFYERTDPVRYARDEIRRARRRVGGVHGGSIVDSAPRMRRAGSSQGARAAVYTFAELRGGRRRVVQGVRGSVHSGERVGMGSARGRTPLTQAQQELVERLSAGDRRARVAITALMSRPTPSNIPIDDAVARMKARVGRALRPGAPLLLLGAPCGTGKSTIAVHIAAARAADQGCTGIVTPTNRLAQDLVERIQHRKDELRAHGRPSLPKFDQPEGCAQGDRDKNGRLDPTDEREIGDAGLERPVGGCEISGQDLVLTLSDLKTGVRKSPAVFADAFGAPEPEVDGPGPELGGLDPRGVSAATSPKPRKGSPRRLRRAPGSSEDTFAGIERWFGPASLSTAPGELVCRYPEAAREVARAGMSVRATMCRGCSHRSRCPATGLSSGPGARRGVRPRSRGVGGGSGGGVVVTNQKLLDAVLDRIGEEGLLVVDEMPPLFEHEELSGRDLRAVVESIACGDFEPCFAELIRPAVRVIERLCERVELEQRQGEVESGALGRIFRETLDRLERDDIHQRQVAEGEDILARFVQLARRGGKARVDDAQAIGTANVPACGATQAIKDDSLTVSPALIAIENLGDAPCASEEACEASVHPTDGLCGESYSTDERVWRLWRAASRCWPRLEEAVRGVRRRDLLRAPPGVHVQARRLKLALRTLRLLRALIDTREGAHAHVRLADRRRRGGRQHKPALVITRTRGDVMRALTRDGPTIVLEAFAHAYAPLVRRATGRNIACEAVHVADAAGVERVFAYAAHASKRALTLRGRSTAWGRFAPKLSHAIERAIERDARSMLIITHKIIADELRAHLQEGRDVPHEDLQYMLERWSEGGRTLSVGHYGALRGLDDWKRTDVIASIGDPWPNLDDVRTEMHLLGVFERDVDGQIEQLVSIELGHAHGRGRAVRRTTPLLSLHYGQIPPAGWNGGNSVVLRLPRRRPMPNAMESGELLEALQSFETYKDFAQAIGRTPRQVRNYRSGRSRIPPGVARRIREAAAARTERTVGGTNTESILPTTPDQDVLEPPPNGVCLESRRGTSLRSPKRPQEGGVPPAPVPPRFERRDSVDSEGGASEERRRGRRGEVRGSAACCPAVGAGIRRSTRPLKPP